eukprot:gene11006-3712_t
MSSFLNTFDSQCDVTELESFSITKAKSEKFTPPSSPPKEISEKEKKNFKFLKKVEDAIYEDNIEKLKILIENGFKINERYKYPIGCELKLNGEDILWTPLQYSYALVKPHIIKFLIQNGAETTLRDATGKTANEIAKTLGNKNVIDLL